MNATAFLDLLFDALRKDENDVVIENGVAVSRRAQALARLAAIAEQGPNSATAGYAASTTAAPWDWSGENDTVDRLLENCRRDGGIPRPLFDALTQILTDAATADRLLSFRFDEGLDADEGGGPTRPADSLEDSFFNEDVKENKKGGDRLAIEWSAKTSDVSAYEYYCDKFEPLPKNKRPTADEIRRASLEFYNAIAKHQSRRGNSIGDLFPIDDRARGGSKAKGGGDLSYEGLLRRLERQRESRRISMAKWRAKRKTRDQSGEPK